MSNLLIGKVLEKLRNKPSTRAAHEVDDQKLPLQVFEQVPHHGFVFRVEAPLFEVDVRHGESRVRPRESPHEIRRCRGRAPIDDDRGIHVYVLRGHDSRSRWGTRAYRPVTSQCTGNFADSAVLAARGADSFPARVRLPLVERGGVLPAFPALVPGAS